MANDTSFGPRKSQMRPGLLRNAQAAHWSGLSLSSWDRKVREGLTPAPIKLGGCVLFSRRQLELWAMWGCPSRDEFVVMFDACRKGGQR